jgi:hypothetical protein
VEVHRGRSRSKPQRQKTRPGIDKHCRDRTQNKSGSVSGVGKPWGHDAQPPFRTSPGAQRRPPEPIKRGEASGAPADLKTAPRPAVKIDAQYRLALKKAGDMVKYALKPARY